MPKPHKQLQLMLQKAYHHLAQGDAEAAILDAKLIVQQFPIHPEAHLLLARVYKTKGQTEKRLNAAIRAHQLSPNFLAATVFLGETYVDLRVPEFAIHLLLKSERENPTDYQLNIVLGRCYMQLEKGHKARICFERAVEAAMPNYPRTIALFHLANCMYDIGDVERATQLLDQLCTKDPPPIEALLKRGNSAEKPVPEWLEPALRKVALNVHQKIDTRARAYLGLGRCRDVQGKYDEAFELWTQSRTLLGIQEREPSKLHFRLNQTRTLFTRSLLRSVEEFGDSSISPILVVGMPRSGTTLTAQILTAHHLCVSVGETNRFKSYDTVFRRENDATDSAPKLVADAKSGALLKIADEFKNFFSIFLEGSKVRPVDKSPMHFESLGFARMIFPRIKIVHCRRHPADNFVSAFQNDMNRDHEYAYDQSKYVDQYIYQEEMMRHWKSCFPEQIFEMRYEETVADQEGITRRLLEFCGLPWDESCLNFYDQQNTVRTFSRTQVRQPLYNTSVGRWRRYGRNLDTIINKLRLLNYDYDKSMI